MSPLSPAPDAPDAPGSHDAEPGPLTRALHSQQLAFLVVGGINTLVGLGAFAAFHALLGDRIGYMGALVLAYAVAIVIAFLLHRRFVFKVSGHWARDLLRFTTVQASSLAINAVLLPLLVEVGGLHPLLGQTIATGLTVILSFFAHKYFSFARDLGPGYPGEVAEHDTADHDTAGGQARRPR